MELYREIRAFFIKLPYSYREISQDIIDSIWNLSKDISISAIDINKSGEVLVHAEIEFSLEHWNDAIQYLRSALSLLNVKNGYIAVRKVVATANSVMTEIEGYKVTRRGVYNAVLPESPDFLEDIIRFSGRNKKLQQIDAMEKLFRFIEEQEKDNPEETA
ncbi:MAG: hypothetical protein IT388_03965 [Nitrospirales bacterium]|nr:hypothetical protein [Nitrospirales bacterium]